MTEEQTSSGFEEAPARGGSGAGKPIAIGCGVILVLLIAGGVLLMLNWRKWVASSFRAGLVAAVEQSTLADDEKKKLVGTVDRLAHEWSENEMSEDKLESLFDAFKESPSARVLLIMILQANFVDRSGLSDDEKTKIGGDLKRLSRGILEGKISDAELEKLQERLPGRAADDGDRSDESGGLNQVDMSQELDDDDLRELAVEVKALADAKGVPDGPYEIRIADELERVVNEVLGSAAPKPAEGAGSESK